MEVNPNCSEMGYALTSEEKSYLLRVARGSIEAAVKRKVYSPIKPADQNLARAAGVFVTIKKNGELRGCIGLIEPEFPLYQIVSKMAVRAATCDPRFESVREDELKDLRIEISILSPLKKLSTIEEIEIGRHGLIIERGIHRGLLLPQVATENNWNREEFLEYTCVKAGLDTEDYKSPDARLYIFSAEIFGEKELGIPSEDNFAERK
ncbi:MAG TPA: AmmeMemoRadiSam system protein A [Candidatus Acidoferrales bacterium]|nr:AmmeMemoRadiSam system protein A [Candidatus Acidoferrales bacterium]